jgi:hypothetical protein
MTYDELEQYSSYKGTTTKVGDGAVANANLHDMLDTMETND